MKLTSKGLATSGLIFITFLAAIQYVFLSNVPETVSAFSFVCITNIIGIIVLFSLRAKHIVKMEKKTLLKGASLAVLMAGYDIFFIMGARSMDSVVVSSVVSLYFVFIPPILLLLRKKVSFISSIATVLAIIALLLMFGGDAQTLFSSPKVIYLFIANLFFAAYVVAVSVLGEGEDSSSLAFAQMAFSALIAFVGWGTHSVISGVRMSVPTDIHFWLTAIFIGIFIHALYGLIQISCQKHVSALSASLIFSTEIVITMLMDPIMCKLLGTKHTPATGYQVIGAVIFVIATMLVDEGIIARLGYSDIDESPVQKKMAVNTIAFSMIALILSTILSFTAIYSIRDSAVEGSTRLGVDASRISSAAMVDEMEDNAIRLAEDKAKYAEEKLAGYKASTESAAAYATALYKRPNEYPLRKIEFSKEENKGIRTMQIMLRDKDVEYEDIREESELLGNMEDIFIPIIDEHDDMLTIYLGTEDGLLINFDKESDIAAANPYYDYSKSEWYSTVREKGETVFTPPYWDVFGRGLTVTCAAPFYDKDGNFAGCVGTDILMSDLNESIVNDGIEAPVSATLIDEEGYVIAGKELDPESKETLSIFDENADSKLRDLGKVILERKNGILKTGDDKNDVYVTYSTIDSTGWILCVVSPVSTIVVPARMIRDTIDGNTESVVTTVVHGAHRVVQNCLVLTAVILLIITFTAGLFTRRILGRMDEDDF